MIIKVIPLILFSISTICVQAQYRTWLIPSLDPLLTSYAKGDIQLTQGFRMPGLRMKKVGTTLTIGGAALLIGGTILASSGELEYDPYTGSVTDISGPLGVLMIIGGVGMIVPGIILWNKGAKKYNRYLQEQNMALLVKGNRLVFRYRF